MAAETPPVPALTSLAGIRRKRGYCYPCSRRSRRLREVSKEFLRRDRERPRKFDDVFQTHVPLPPLHSANIVAMQPSAFGQGLLRVAPLVAELPQRKAKSQFNGTWCHPSMLEW